MFHWSFAQLLLIVLVAFLVFGPKELPQVMRTVGTWIAKAQKIWHNASHELNKTDDG